MLESGKGLRVLGEGVGDDGHGVDALSLYISKDLRRGFGVDELEYFFMKFLAEGAERRGRAIVCWLEVILILWSGIGLSLGHFETACQS